MPTVHDALEEREQARRHESKLAVVAHQKWRRQLEFISIFILPVGAER